jgi:formate dehydrogenase maturation protein FdhE
MSDVIGLRSGSILGEAAKPPFAVLPDPAALFFHGMKRLAALARAHDLAPYLSFLATRTCAQHDIQRDLAPATLPPFERIGQAVEHGMAPLAKAQLGSSPVIELAVEPFLDGLADDLATLGLDMLMAHGGAAPARPEPLPAWLLSEEGVSP